LWAVVGLGNPGRQYSGTRHNVGLTLVRRVAKGWKVKLRKKIFFSKAAEVERNKEKVLLAIPLTYMNKSGQAVKQILEGRRIELENLIVVYDDLDIPLGEIRVKKRGGPGNHKGMISIVQEIESEEFPRIRIGIGPLTTGENAVDYVLSRFNRLEAPLLKESLKKAQEAVELVLAGEADKAMNIYNQRGKTLFNSP
jgi:PTH1 family peptidyl-tRNA hydrolase